MSEHNKDETEQETEKLWPSDLQLDDKMVFDGDEYIVVGTGRGEATLHPVDADKNTEMKVFRWALINSVGIELETSISQEEFQQLVEREENAE